MIQQKIAVITGANRGIGFAIAEGLARRGVLTVVTSRREDAGREAARKLQELGGLVDFHRLDVTSEEETGALAAHLKDRYGRLDILVNNAGILLEEDGPLFSLDLNVLRKTLETNALGALRVLQGLRSLLLRAEHARVLQVSSGMGAFHQMGGGYAAYRISKTCLNAITVIAARELAGKPISINSVCPGWVRTEMGGKRAERTPAQGADTVIWLALDAPKELTGKFFRDRKVIPW